MLCKWLRLVGHHWFVPLPVMFMRGRNDLYQFGLASARTAAATKDPKAIQAAIKGQTVQKQETWDTIMIPQQAKYTEPITDIDISAGCIMAISTTQLSM